MLTLFDVLLTKNAVDHLQFVSRKRVVLGPINVQSMSEFEFSAVSGISLVFTDIYS